MISGISEPSIMAGGGLGVVETRMQQIEGMIQAIEARRATALQTSQAASLPLNPSGNPATAVGTPGTQGLPKPFQFYLQAAKATQNPGNSESLASLLHASTGLQATTGANAISGKAGVAELDLSELSGAPAKNTTVSGKALAFQPMVESVSSRYGVDKDLVNALIRQESGFNPNAISHSGAKGLMQLMPGTAKSLGVTNAQDPAQNLEGGVRYLRGLIDQFNGNIPLALAAYNAGPGAVTRHKGIPPYKETQHYVRTILANFLKTKQDQPS